MVSRAIHGAAGHLFSGLLGSVEVVRAMTNDGSDDENPSFTTKFVDVNRDEVTENGRAENLGSVGARVDNIDEWVSRDEQAEECRAETNERGPLEPHRQRPAESGDSGKRNGKHCEISKFVMSEAGIREDLEGFLRVHSDICQHSEQKNEG